MNPPVFFIGQLIMLATSKSPAGFVRCGSSLKVEQYPKLARVLGIDMNAENFMVPYYNVSTITKSPYYYHICYDGIYPLSEEKI